jgi:hypothetical protein
MNAAKNAKGVYCMKNSFFSFAAPLLLAFTTLSCGPEPVSSFSPQPANPPVISPISYEAEDFKSSLFGGQGSPGQVRIEDQSNASGAKAVHMGPDSDILSGGIGDTFIYSIDIPESMELKNGKVEVRYSDDVAGNAVALYLDGARKGSFSTGDSGTWNDFTSSCQKIDLGIVSKGTHTLELQVVEGGNYGVIIDRFTLSASPLVHIDGKTAAYLFIKSLIDSNTGLVKSTECEQWTTIYKNALASMAFIHEGDIAEAEGIFDFFNARYDAASFQGFTKTWNAATGEPEASANYWEGDNAFLLIALHYYRQKTGSLGDYQGMTDGLITWLAGRGNSADEAIIPEGLIDMFAALKPFEASLPAGTPDVLLKLQSGFRGKADYANTGDHIERAALTTGDISGFGLVSNLTRSDTWQHDGQAGIQALSAFSSESFINAEISAQLLLAWRLHRSSLAVNLAYLEGELEKMWLPGSKDIRARGLPYLSREYSADHNPVWYDYPMIDPTCYLLFYYWGFNPMVPGARNYDLKYDFHECEDIESQTGSGNPETHSDAVGDKTFQIGSGYNEVTYRVNLHREYHNAKLNLRYSDDVAGNVISVYVDDVYKGEFTTVDSGGWETFTWSPDVLLGAATAGDHTVKLISPGGTYGVNLDIMKVSAAKRQRPR